MRFPTKPTFWAVSLQTDRPMHDRSAVHGRHLMLPSGRNFDEDWRVKLVHQVAHPSDSLLFPVFAFVEEACLAAGVVFHVSCLR